MPAKSLTRGLALCLLLLCPLFAQAQRAALDVPTDRLIVKWRKGAAGHAQILAAPDRRISQAHLEALARRTGVRLAPYRAMSDDAQVLKLDGRRSVGEVRAIAARLASHPDIEYAVPDQKRFPSAAPNDPYFAGKLQSNLTTLNVPLAWDITTGSPLLVVAVLDTGILPHPDLAGRALAGYDFVSDAYHANDGAGRDASAVDPGDWVSWSDVDDPSSPFDSACLYGGIYETFSSWHGTHIAGINWNSKILPVRVLGKCGGYDSDIIDGMRWAAGISVPGAPSNPTPAKVLNLSLGGPGSCNAAWQSAIDQVTGLNKVIVVAAGNEGVDFSTVTPASCQGVITVAAHDPQNNRSFYSNFGSAAATQLFAAPGDNIYSTSDGGARTALNDALIYNEYGTSGATAHVSGIVSLMLSANSALTPAQVRQILRDSSTSLGDWAGSGKPDALQAVGNALAFRGAGVVPVSLTINGPGSVFEDVTASYTATVTWSASSNSPVYPPWSLVASIVPTARLGNAGTLPAFSVNSDQSATVQASFTANGVTVTASKAVNVLDNYVTSLAVSGPATVYLSNPSPAVFSASATWRDLRVTGADVAWSATSGSISAGGLFFPSGLGAVTVTATAGTVTASANATVVSGAPGSGSFSLTCASENVAGLTLDQLRFLDVGSSSDIVPLCDGKLLVADRLAHRIDVIDAPAGAIIRSWSLSAAPSRMELAAGSSKLFVTFFGSGTGMASIDLAAPDNAPQYISVPDYTAQLISGDVGQIWVLHSPSDFFVTNVSLSRYRVSDGALLQTHSLPRAANFMQYSKSRRILITTLALSGGARVSYDVAPDTFALTERENLTDAGGLLKALSPDGTRLLLNGKDLDVQALTSNRGTWAGAGAGGFSPDGKQLAANKIDTYDNDLVIYSTERHVALKTFPKPDNCAYWGYQATRFSPTGAFVFGYEQCGFSGEYGRLFWVPISAEPTPDAIAFDSQTGVAPGALLSSNGVTLSGFTGAASISVSGGQYSINGAAFTSAAGTVSAGQSVAVRAQAPSGSYATAAATLSVGAIQASFLVTTGSPLLAQWWNPSCGAEADLGSQAVSFADIDPAWDMIALCDGRLLAGNRKQNRVELYDVRAGSAVRTWLLNAAPEVLRLVPGSSTLLVVTNASSVARIDLASGQIGYIDAGGRPFDVAPGEPGEMIVVKQAFPSLNTIEGDTMVVHGIASGALLATNFLGASVRASLVRYDAAGKHVFTGDSYHSPAQLTRFNYMPATHAISLDQNSLDAGDYAHDLVLSPDRARIAYPVEGGIPDVLELSPQSLAQNGRWASGPFPRAADFRSDSAKLLIGSEVNLTYRNGIQLFDAATHQLERSWLLQHCEAAQAKMRRVRLSPSGSYAFALETCGSFEGDSARLSWAPTSAARPMRQPNPVAFVSKTAAPPNTDIVSNEILITGLAGLSVPISVTGGTYQIGGPPFTAFNGFVRDGDRVRVKQTSWFESGVTTTTTLNVGGELLAFNVTTGVAGTDTAPDPFRLYTLKARPLDTEFTSNTIFVTGIDAPTPISVSGGRYSVNGGAYTAASGSVVNGDTVTVRMTSANSTNTTSAAILTIGNFSTNMTVTTGGVDTTPDNFAFAPRFRIPRSTWIESASVT